jgi:Nitronate monooxygenase
VRTPVCELLGIAHPIVQAPIGAAAAPQLAAAVSEAGALGMVALTWVGGVAGTVRDTAALTGRPFGGNALRNATASVWEAAGCPPPGARPGEHEAVAQGAAGQSIARYSSTTPLVGMTVAISALSMWAGQSVALAKRPQTAAEIVADLVAGVE